jgi:4-amino-4-deoxy-L-arabinose transferase-like glycosyltransferase
MPLTRDNVTAASRRMLPTYPCFFGAIGLGLLLTPLDRLLQTPTFHYANDLISIRLWGAGFLALAAVFIAALLTHTRKTYQYALGVAIGWMTLWAVVAAASATDLGSFTAWAWPAFIARACWASLVSLETRET